MCTRVGAKSESNFSIKIEDDTPTAMTAMKIAAASLAILAAITCFCVLPPGKALLVSGLACLGVTLFCCHDDDGPLEAISNIIQSALPGFLLGLFCAEQRRPTVVLAGARVVPGSGHMHRGPATPRVVTYITPGSGISSPRHLHPGPSLPNRGARAPVGHG